MINLSNVAGQAALGICESTLLALTDRGLITTADAQGILEDTITAHRNAIPHAVDGDAETHEAVAVLLEAILAGGNTIRHP